VELLQTLKKDDKVGPLLGNVQKNYYSVVWQSTGPDGKDVITRVLVHVGLPPQHAARIPGLSSKFPAPAKTDPQPPFPAPEGLFESRVAKLLDVLLTDAIEARLTSVYVSTP